MNEEIVISEVKIDKLAHSVAKTLKLSRDEAYEVIYEEWDLVENLFNSHMTLNEIHNYFCEEINTTYWIA
jgi:hypothetical protein